MAKKTTNYTKYDEAFFMQMAKDNVIIEIKRKSRNKTIKVIRIEYLMDKNHKGAWARETSYFEASKPTIKKDIKVYRNVVKLFKTDRA